MAKIKVITRKEFTSFLNVKSATLRQLIKRDTIKESKTGFINVYNPTNQDWILDYCSKNGIDIKPIFDQTAVNSVPTRKESKEIERKEKETNYIEPVTTAYTILRDNKLKKETEVKQIEAELKQLELSKKKAKVVPTDFIGEMFQMYFKGNFNGAINDGYSIIEKIVDELGGNYQTKLKYKKEFKLMVGETFKNNHENVSGEIIEKAKDYAISTKW